ncbi:MAG: hypothetical protein Q4G13_01985 [Moraxella sp.]|nr:hypothetical protein [Moraxella sp.]
MQAFIDSSGKILGLLSVIGVWITFLKYKDTRQKQRTEILKEIIPKDGAFLQYPRVYQEELLQRIPFAKNYEPHAFYFLMNKNLTRFEFITLGRLLKYNFAKFLKFPENQVLLKTPWELKMPLLKGIIPIAIFFIFAIPFLLIYANSVSPLVKTDIVVSGINFWGGFLIMIVLELWGLICFEPIRCYFEWRKKVSQYPFVIYQ